MTTISDVSENAAPEAGTDAAPAQLRSRDERLAAGKALRDRASRKSHSVGAPPGDRRDPLTLRTE
ncbi:MAG TPA: hypothetical protein VL379_19205 [Pseudomonadales bacterium]|jgi:hypothetical protein|nr:hypothetical protein [Pseudomonadales bacterium]